MKYVVMFLLFLILVGCATFRPQTSRSCPHPGGVTLSVQYLNDETIPVMPMVPGFSPGEPGALARGVLPAQIVVTIHNSNVNPVLVQLRCGTESGSSVVGYVVEPRMERDLFFGIPRRVTFSRHFFCEIQRFQFLQD